MNSSIWTVYDDKIDECRREIQQLEVLITNENWKFYNRESHRKEKIYFSKEGASRRRSLEG